ncbi:ExbD/TolR family protein [Marichromatium gracile]|uniref:Biopolymer transporter ExbD n=1 Tax=Marichromatium gracile TaxID=1048 RepID=A0ABR5VEA8_MARGR|nr:biopolymer transporter ExbD [Marichromatium gracile]KXX64014.1 biopolymer transporter ExbD [Marichromatium gracile]
MAYPPRRRARIEVVAMIDIIFFLLAFFMLATLETLPARGLDGQLPASATASRLDPADVVIVLARDGAISVAGAPLDHQRLTALLRDKGPRTQVTITGAGAASLTDLVAVMDACRAAGITAIALATREVGA